MTQKRKKDQLEVGNIRAEIIRGERDQLEV